MSGLGAGGSLLALVARTQLGVGQLARVVGNGGGRGGGGGGEGGGGGGDGGFGAEGGEGGGAVCSLQALVGGGDNSGQGGVPERKLPPFSTRCAYLADRADEFYQEMKRTNRDQSHRVRSRGTGDGGDGVHVRDA
eukprot:765610-Prorocentrum_minimum.AAC.1